MNIQVDGTYPYDGSRWSLIKNIGGTTRDGHPNGQREAERLVEKHLGFHVDLTHFLNKGFLVYNFGISGGGLPDYAHAVYCHDGYWSIILTEKPQVIQEVKERRKQNLERAKGDLLYLQRQLASKELGAFSVQHYQEDYERAEAWYELHKKLHDLTTSPVCNCGSTKYSGHLKGCPCYK